MLETQVNQEKLPAYLEGRSKPFRLNKRGELVVSDWLQQAALDGYCFNVAEATPDTLLTGDVGYVATRVGFLLSVPSGVTVFPYWVNVAIEDSAGTDNYIIIGCDDSILYASGGTTACSTINNVRTDNPRASVCTAYNSDNELIITDPGASERILFTWHNAFADVATDDPRVIVWEPLLIPKLVGPASFFFYSSATGTAQEFNFSVQWAEIPTPSA